MWDSKDGGSRYVEGQDQAYWAGKRLRCTTRWNGNGGFDGFVSISHRRAADKEASRPSYWRRDKTMPMVSWADFWIRDYSDGLRQRRHLAAALDRNKRWKLKKNDNTKLTPLYVDPRKIIFDRSLII